MARTGKDVVRSRNRPSVMTWLAIAVAVVALLLTDDLRVWARAALYLIAAVSGASNLVSVRRAGGGLLPEFWLLTLSCAMFSVSNVLRALQPAGGAGEVSNGVAGLILIVAGLVFVRRIRTGHGLRIILDGFIVGTMSAMVFRETIVAIGGRTTAGSIPSVLLILGLVGVSMWLRAIATDPSMAVRSFAVAVGLALMGDVLVGVMDLPAARPVLVDVWTIVSTVVLVYGLAHPGLSDRVGSDAPPYRPITASAVVMMLLALAVAPATIWSRLLSGSAPDVVMASGLSVLTLLWVARFAVMLKTRDVHRERLNKELRTDPLTGVASRRRLMEHLDERVARSRGAVRGEDARWAVLLIDLDDFKSINDKFGHAAGDALLIDVATRLRDSVGDRGLVARLAGDEFAIVTDEEGTVILRDVRAALATDVGLDGRDGPGVRASVGMAAAWPDEASAESVLDRADQSMYAEKRRHQTQGRRRADRTEDAILRSNTR